MLEVYTWEPNANSGKPLFCLAEKQIPFTFHISTWARAGFSGDEVAAAGIAPAPPLEDWLARLRQRPSVAADAVNECEVITMGPERGRWG